MTALVAEEGVARLVASSERLVVVGRARRRGSRGWAALEADRVVDALALAGPGAVVLARDPEVDPGGGRLADLARVMGHDVVRLPREPVQAAWAIGVASHRDFEDDGLVRRLEALLGVLSASGPLPRRSIGADGLMVPALRPGALSKWAGCAWRACRRCPGGGPAGGRCGRCGAPDIPAAP